MADPIFTLAKTKGKRLAGAVFVTGTFTSDGGTYVAGGHPVTPLLASFDAELQREPDIVLFEAANGFQYEYNPTTKKVLIRVATTAGTNAPENEHTGVAVVAAARTNVKFLAIWLAGVDA